MSKKQKTSRGKKKKGIKHGGGEENITKSAKTNSEESELMKDAQEFPIFTIETINHKYSPDFDYPRKLAWVLRIAIFLVFTLFISANLAL